MSPVAARASIRPEVYQTIVSTPLSSLLAALARRRAAEFTLYLCAKHGVRACLPLRETAPVRARQNMGGAREKEADGSAATILFSAGRRAPRDGRARCRRAALCHSGGPSLQDTRDKFHIRKGREQRVHVAAAADGR